MITTVRQAARSLMWRPGFTLTALLTLTLGIGVCTAMFSVVDAVLLKPVGIVDEDRFVLAGETAPTADLNRGAYSPSTSPVVFFEWRDRATAFSHLGASAIYPIDVILTGRERAESLKGRGAAAGFFETLGVQPLFGRTFLREEDRDAAEPTVMLTYRFWHSRLGADPTVLGSVLRMNGQSRRVIGILPPNRILDSENTDVWLPLALEADEIEPRNFMLIVHGRLKPGVTLAQAEADLTSIETGLRQDGRSSTPDAIVRVRPYREHLVGADMREATLLLAGAVAFVLLIACTNLAHLLMARYVQIRKDIAIRVALGASRTHVIEQFLAESLILCLLGGSCGWLVAAGLIRGLLSMMPPAMFLQNVDVALDGRVLVFTAVLALATGVAFGLLPVWTFARGDLRSAGLNIAAPRGGATSGPFARHALLAAELALTLTLVSGSVLMLRSLTQLFAVDSGFQVAQTLAVRVKLDQTYFTTRPAVLNYQETMLTGIRALPGVASAAVSNVLPLIGRNSSTGVTLAGLPTSRVGAGQRFVSEDYFAAMGISVVRGRGLFESDMAGSAKTAVINETLARTLAKHRDPLNARILFHGQPVTIVGIVGDVKYWGPTSQQLNEIYVPLAQAPEKIALPELAFIIRATGEPAMLVRALRIMSTPLDRDVAVVGVRTMGEYLNDTVARPRFLGTLFGLFGVLSLGLTAVGIYGVISHLVSQRTREFGIRLALGAQRRDLLRLVMLEGLVVTLIGVSLGLFGALLLGRALSTLLFQVSASDPLLYAAAAILLTAVALLACWIPARRATAADPLVVLRAER